MLGVRSGRATLAVLALLAAPAISACGDDEEQPQQPAAAQPAASTEPGPIAIERPVDDRRIRATDDGGELRARPTVGGTADPGQEVALNSGCSVEGCVVHVAADDAGRWEVPVRLVASAGTPVVRITAYYRGSVVGPQDRVEVRLAAPERDRGGDRGRGGGGDGRGGGGAGRGPGPPVPPEALDAPAPGAGPAGSGPQELVLIGDSLAVGIEDLLPAALPGWRIRSDALTSRPLDQGMAILARTEVAPGSVVAVSLFTNDDPGRTGPLESAVRASVRRAGAGGCAIWATIARPPYGGRSYAAANGLLRRLDAELGPRLAVVPWAESAARNGWLAGDGVHGTPEGYRARATMYAQAARSCG